MNVKDILKKTKSILEDREPISKELYNHIRKLCIEDCGYPIIDEVLDLIPYKKPKITFHEKD